MNSCHPETWAETLLREDLLGLQSLYSSNTGWSCCRSRHRKSLRGIDWQVQCRSDLRQAFSCLREPGKYWISKDISNRWAMGKMQRQRREAEMQDSVLVYSAVYWPMKNTPISWRPLGKCTETLLLRYDPTKLNPGPKHTHRSHKREERKGGGLYEVGMRGWGSAVCSRMK